MSDTFSAVKAQEEALLCRSYSRYPVAVVRGKGSRLWDVDGKEYVDLLAGIAVTALGHCNDEVCAALEAQAHKLWHVSNLYSDAKLVFYFEMRKKFMIFFLFFA